MSKLGKFQGEPNWVESLWEMALESMDDFTRDEDAYVVSYFILTDELRATIEEDTIPEWAESVGVYEDAQGFIWHCWSKRVN
jgi:hypothetical protein